MQQNGTVSSNGAGTRQYSPDAPAKKKLKELQKGRDTTIGTLGLRVVGARVPSSDYTATAAWGYNSP